MIRACVKCQRNFKIKSNDVLVEEGMPSGMKDGQGTSPWRPYKLYLGDLYECDRCGTQLVITAINPIKEHFMEDYEEFKEYYRALGRLLPMVEDCQTHFRPPDGGDRIV